MVNPSSQYIDSAPAFINKDRGRSLINKWSKILEFTDSQTAPIVGYQKQLATSIILENQENYLKQQGFLRPNVIQENGMIAGGAFASTPFGGGTPGSAPTVNGQYGNALGSSDWYAPGDARLPKTLIPMIRRTFPELITHEIVGVQPMSGPVGLAFALRYQYDQTSLGCSPYDDKNCTASSSKWNPNGQPFNTNHLGSGEAGYQKLYTAHTGITAAGLSGNADFAVPAIDSGVAQLLSHFEASSNIPTMSLKIEKTAVEAGTRKLGTSWSMELEQDLMNMNGIDIDAEMTNAMSYEIQAEIDREMVIRMIQVALNAGQGSANFIVATPKVCTILQLLPEFRPFEISSNIQVHPNGVARVGSLAGQFNIYRDTRSEAQYLAGVRATSIEYALLGYKGSEFYDTGIVYCPYIPVLVQRTISPHTMTPNVGMMTRYGVIDSLWGASNFYHIIIVKDIDRNHYSSSLTPASAATLPIYSVSN